MPTYDHLRTTDGQKDALRRIREAQETYAKVLEAELPPGPDKARVLVANRTTAMLANAAIVRHAEQSE